MYEYIRGTVVVKEDHKVVIENQQIGYGISTSSSSLARIELNEQVTMYTYLHVKEDIFLLYGFIDPEELKLFKMLISISGVGPKAGLSVLSTLTTNEIALAIATGDDKQISKAVGIGKKTALRIILELKDKFKSYDIDENSMITKSDEHSELFEEAKLALLVLGFKATDARKIIEKVYEKNDTLEVIIRKALRAIS